MHFNYTPNSKTPKGTKPLSTRIITKEHSAYKIFLRGKDLQREDGIFNSRVDPKYIDLAIKELNNNNN
jgi:hypothetical protein